MAASIGNVPWDFRPQRIRCWTRLPLCLVLALLIGTIPHGASAQVDTTRVTDPDTVQTQTDTTKSAPSDTTQGNGSGKTPQTPRDFADPGYGRPVVDSLPTLTPHVGLEHVLAQDPGSFLYDLGNVGWPHGWSRNGQPPHRSTLWIDGVPYNSPLTGRARFDLLPPSFLEQPRLGTDPAGSAIGVHTSWRSYDQVRPITELRFRRDSNGLKAIEVAHSQKHRIAPFGTPAILQITGGYGGRTTAGAYDGTDLRRERRIWGRLRYHGETWAIELTDLSSRHRTGAHSGVLPPEGNPLPVIYLLPACQTCSQNVGAQRNTYRNDLTARVRGPLLPGVDQPVEGAATWTSNTFDYRAPRDTTWSTKLNGGHARIQQPFSLGPHHFTLDVRGSLWNTAWSNVPEIDGARWSTHVHARDSVRIGATDLTLDAGWHVTDEKQYPSAAAAIEAPVGPLRVDASASLSEQRASWFESAGFMGFIQPLDDPAPSASARIVEGTVGAAYEGDILGVRAEGFAHRVERATDLYAPLPTDGQRLASSDTVFARQTAEPVHRVGATLSASVRKDASSGLYLTAEGTAVTMLNDRASLRHVRLARTLPTLHGKARIGARFVFFQDLNTDLYLQVRGWSALGRGWNSRWFHPPTGRFVVPPLETPLPVRPTRTMGTNGTADLHAEIKLRGATLFFTFENIQASFARTGSFQRQATLQNGTFVVPIYPLPARQFRFGVHWPIFD